MMSPRTRLHGLSGTGAGAGLYPQPWSTLPGFVAHDWPPYRGERSIADVASSCIEAWDIRDGDILIGTSLGGMVACEIAKRRRIARLYLVASALSPGEMSRVAALLHPLAQILPMASLWWAAGKVPGEVTRMFKESDPRFVRAMCRAIFTWPGWTGGEPRPIRLHGRRDRLIPAPATADCFLDAGHLIVFTRPKECVAFVRSDLQAHGFLGSDSP